MTLDFFFVFNPTGPQETSKTDERTNVVIVVIIIAQLC